MSRSEKSGLVRRLKTDEALVVEAWDEDGEPVEIEITARWHTRNSINYKAVFPEDSTVTFTTRKVTAGADNYTPHGQERGGYGDE